MLRSEGETPEEEGACTNGIGSLKLDEEAEDGGQR